MSQAPLPTPQDRRLAVQYLMNHYPNEAFCEVRTLMQNKQTAWHRDSAFGFGMEVRNALRAGGFKWSDQYLDDHWFEIVEDAVAQMA